MAASPGDNLAQEGTEARLTSKWLRDAIRHSASWAAGATADNAPVQEKLQGLGIQLACHKDYPTCSEADAFLPGCGSSRPSTVFVSLHPSPHDHAEGTAYSEGSWVSVFLGKLASISVRPGSNCYLMYVFPYYLGKNREPTAEENDIFPRYALARIALLQPQLVVALGARAGKYVFTGFDGKKLCNAARYSDVIRRIVSRGAPDRPRGNTGYPPDTGLLASSHPFQLMQFLSDSDGVRTQNPAFSEEAVQNFASCLGIINKIVNRYKVPGPKVLDARTGTYVVNPMPAMRRAAAEATTTTGGRAKRQASPHTTKNKPLPRGQSVIDRFVKRGAASFASASAPAPPGKRKEHPESTGREAHEEKVYYCKHPKMVIRLTRG